MFDVPIRLLLIYDNLITHAHVDFVYANANANALKECLKPYLFQIYNESCFAILVQIAEF